ncbi:hypothetical protein CCP3SC15_210019 [Gammaproteobacteria bacterium]
MTKTRLQDNPIFAIIVGMVLSGIVSAIVSLSTNGVEHQNMTRDILVVTAEAREIKKACDDRNVSNCKDLQDVQTKVNILYDFLIPESRKIKKIGR